MRHDDLYLWYLGDPARPRYVGHLRLVASGKGVSLEYDAAWLAHGFALSEDLPLTAGVFLPPSRMGADAPRAVGAVDDARPDRWGEKVIRFIDRPRRLSLMEYLYHAGDDRFGALGVSTSSTRYQPRPGGALPRLEDAQRLSDVVAKIEAAEPLSATEARIIAGGGSPLGGAKPKALIEIDGAQWVIKFFNGEPFDSPLVEHAAMTLARQAGITVAETMPVRLAASHAIAVRRFDRAQGRRIHSLCAGTAIRAATPAHQAPEMGYPALALVLRRIGVSQDGANLHDARELFRRMVFNILIDNTDDHEKNHALLVVHTDRHGRLRLAPAYDVLPTSSGQGMQEFVCGHAGPESSLLNALSDCAAFGLATADAAAEIDRVLAVVDGWKAHFAATGVAAGDIDYLAQSIDGDALAAARRDFVARPADVATRRGRKPGPFGRV